MAFTVPAFAQFPYVENFENDVDSFTPTDGDLFNDPNFGGTPPNAHLGEFMNEWADIRSGFDAAIEEAPVGSNGFMGSIPSPDGSANIGVVQLNGAEGPLGRQAQQDTWPFSGTTTGGYAPGRFSTRMDIYADPSIPAGTNGTPDVWWTHKISVQGTFDTLTEAGMTFTAGPSNDWIFATTAGQSPVSVPNGQWYTMEMIIENDTTASGAGKTGLLQLQFKLWNADRAGMPLWTYTQTPDQVYLGGGTGHPMSSVGSFVYAWITHADGDIGSFFVDNTGVDLAIGYADMNGDGVVNNFDIQPFEKALTNTAAYQAEFLLTDQVERGDINLDGVFNNFDIQPFEQYLTSGSAPAAAPAAVPEPGSMVLLGLGLLGLAAMKLRRRSA